MKTKTIRILCFALALSLVCGLTACKGSDPDGTTAVETESATEPATEAATEPASEPETFDGELADGQYTLESEEDGYSLTLNAVGTPPVFVSVDEEDGVPGLSVTSVYSSQMDFGLRLCVERMTVADYTAQEAQTPEEDHSAIRVGHYSGYTLSADTAVLYLAELPGGEEAFVLRLTALRSGTQITDVFSDAGIAAFLATAEFNINV